MTALVAMTADEARACVENIRASYNDMRRNVYNLYMRRGWVALGYDSFQACLEKEFSRSWQHLYRLKKAEEIQVEINSHSPMGETIALPERQARVLSVLPSPESRHNAYVNATTLAKAEGQAVSVRHVERAVAMERTRERVTQSPYHVISHMMASGDITPMTAEQMVTHLENTAPRFQAYLLEMIAKFSITCPDLLPELVSMKDRREGKESLTLKEIEASGMVAGVPLRKATLTDLQRARWEAQQAHIAESTETKTPKDVPVIITVYKGDVERTLKALAYALSAEDLRALAEAIAIAQTPELQSEPA